MSPLDHIAVPLWYLPVMARYRRLSPSERAILDLILAGLWRWYRPGDDRDPVVETNQEQLARDAGLSIRHVRRTVRALLETPGKVLETSPLIHGQGILREISRSRRTQQLTVRLNHWSCWWWAPDTRFDEIEAAIARYGVVTLTPGEKLATELVSHLRWVGRLRGDEPQLDPGSVEFGEWASLLGAELAAHNWTAADVRFVLDYVEGAPDKFWREHLRGVRAAKVLVDHWEGLLVRARRAHPQPAKRGGRYRGRL